MPNLSVYLKDSTKEKFEALAAVLGSSSNEFIVKVLELFLDSNDLGIRTRQRMYIFQ